MEVLLHFEIEPDSCISEVTVGQIMASLGFILLSNDSHIEDVQTIFYHLQPVGGDS